MRVAELMSRALVTIAPTASLDEALDLMDEHGIRHLPLVEDGALIGLVTDRDLLSSTGWLPARMRSVYQGDGARDYRVKDIARCPAMTAKPDDEALSLLVFEHVSQGSGGLPVVDADGALVGVLTEIDILRALAERDPPGRDPVVRDHMTEALEMVQATTTLGEARDICHSRGVRHLPVLGNAGLIGMVSDRDLRRGAGAGRALDCPVDKVMTRGVTTISADARMSEAARRMVDTHGSALPVEEHGELVGILTTLDMLDHAIDVARPTPTV